MMQYPREIVDVARQPKCVCGLLAADHAVVMALFHEEMVKILICRGSTYQAVERFKDPSNDR